MTALRLRKKAEDAAAALAALMIRAERAAHSVFQGEHAQRKSGAGEKFWQFREYAPGDRSQDIDWRQSAKADGLYIRQKERQLPQTALFWACSARSMDYASSSRLPAKRDAARVLTLSLAILMTRANERIGMLGAAQTGRSEAALENIGAALLAERDAAELPFLGPHRAQKNATIFLAGDFLGASGEMEACLNNIAAQAGGCVIQILDPAEIELPWSGRVIFEEPEAKIRELAPNVASIREAYKKRIHDHINAIRKISSACGWHYVLHRTDTPVDKTLMKIWLEMRNVRNA